MPYQFADKRVSAAQVAQLNRVNERDEKPVREMPIEARQGAKAPAPFQISNIPHVSSGALKAMEKEVERLNGIIASLQAELAEYKKGNTGLRYDGRKVITAKEAAKRTNLSLSQVSRYCGDGWESIKTDSNELLIFDDKPLTKRQRGKKSKRK